MNTNRYHRFSPVLVRGYIVNHADNLNYDIWFDFDSITLDNLLSNVSPNGSDRFKFEEPCSSNSYNEQDELNDSDSPNSSESSSPRFDFDNDNIGNGISDRYFMVHKEPFTFTDINVKDGKLIDPLRYNDSVGVIPTKSIKNGVSFRCRLKKIDTIKPVDSILEEVDTLVNYNDRWVLCQISDVDIYNRLLVELYSIDKQYCINEILLKNYPQFFRYYPTNNRFLNKDSNKRYFSFSDSRKVSYKARNYNGSDNSDWKSGR